MPDSESTPEVTVFHAKAMAQSIEATLHEIMDCSADLLETAPAQRTKRGAKPPRNPFRLVRVLRLKELLKLAKTAVADMRELANIIDVVKPRPLPSEQGNVN